MKSTLLISALCAVLAIAQPGYAADQASVVSLTAAKNDHRLHLSFEMPAGWSIEWYPPASTTSTARIFREASGGSEAIVIAASSLGGISPQVVFGHPEFKKVAEMLQASIHQPDASMNWNGVYLNYALPPSVNSTGLKVDVRNWFTTSDGKLVQFQCYFLFDPQLTPEKQSEAHQRIEAEYLEILRSVRATD